LGLGAGAHGHAGGVRYANVKQPRVYLRRLETAVLPYPLTTAVADHHTITREEAMSDAVMTQLRLLQEGLDLAAFAARFGQTAGRSVSRHSRPVGGLGDGEGGKRPFIPHREGVFPQ
jgi:coproporphyrinogen III oxidase-like Fe-S oxidoreductase